MMTWVDASDPSMVQPAKLSPSVADIEFASHATTGGHFEQGSFQIMQSKLEYLERTILELGSQIYRVKHQMDEMSKANSGYRELFISLKRLLDEKGLISTEDFEEAIALDKILNIQNSTNTHDNDVFSDELKKVVN